MDKEGKFLPMVIRVLHAILWKIIIIEFTKVGLKESTYFRRKHIFPITMRRMQKRLNAKIHTHRMQIKNARHKGQKPPRDDKINQLLSPVAQVKRTEVIWHESWRNKCKQYDIDLK